MKKILCLILFLNLSLSASAVDLNWSLTGTESENLIRFTSTSGSIPDIKDNDTNTSRTVSGSSFVPPGAVVEFEHEIAFSETVNTINKIEVVSVATVSHAGGITEFKVYLYYNSTWNLVYTGGTGVWSKQTDDETGIWSNVSKIKLYILGEVTGPENTSKGVTLYNYELRAWGPPNYIDIGLRIRTSSGTIKIGVQDLEATHKLRIRKGGTTYGIPLLATNDADASGVRIYDGSAVKALPKVD